MSEINMPNRALIIADPWIGKILSGVKPWEMRTTKTNIRGRIGLIRKGSGLIVGTANLVDSKDKIDLLYHQLTYEYHRIPYERGLYDKWVFPWVLEDVNILDDPIPYVHPQGAVVWVNFSKKTRRR